MANMQEKKTPIRMQNAKIRAKNYDEVNVGYTLEEAKNEANRCLNCINKPCVKGCPVNVDIPTFIGHIANERIDLAYETITEENCFPSICGRVCPQENQCEKHCVRAIKHESVGIGYLERFVGDHYQKEVNAQTLSKHKVALIGSGPAALACAGELIKAKIQVEIFEALHENGGVLTYGIPEFRLPKHIVKQEINNLIKQGVKIHSNIVVGKTYEISELFELGFEAVFIGVGAGLPVFMNIPNENAVGVFSANEYLTRINLMKAYLESSDTPIIKSEHTVVVGGGNVAMDAARSALRLGQKVSLVYRRSMNELPARHEEVEHAIEEGIDFKVLTNPTEILVDEKGRVRGMIAQKMELVASDSGRANVKIIENSEFEIACDAIIMAIGTSSNPLLTSTTSALALNARGNILVDEKQMTSIDNVYAAGDIVTGAATVINAMGQGKKAAKSIIDKLFGIEN